jgi:hypothetical protein
MYGIRSLQNGGASKKLGKAEKYIPPELRPQAGALVDLIKWIKSNPYRAARNVAESFGPQADIKGMVDSYGSAVQNFRRGNIGAGLRDALYVPANAMTLALPSSASGMRRAAEGLGGGVGKKADDLPMDEASRMARADEMFPKSGFHGTDADISEFDGPVWITDDPSVGSHYAQRARAKTALDENADDFGEHADLDEVDPFLVEGAEDPTGMNVMPLRYDDGRQLDMTELGDAPAPKDLIEWLADKGIVERPDDIGDWLNELTVDPDSRPTLWKMIEDWNLDRDIQNAGYDSLKIKDVVAAKRGTVGHDSTLIFDPKGRVRSRNAKFDPAKADSGDLLALSPEVLKRDSTGRPLQRAPFNPDAADRILDHILGQQLPTDEASRMARARSQPLELHDSLAGPQLINEEIALAGARPPGGGGLRPSGTEGTEQIEFSIFDQGLDGWREVGVATVNVSTADNALTNNIEGLVNIDISPEFRGQGIGQRVVGSLQASSRDGLKLYDIKDDALPFWEQVGATNFKKRPDGSLDADLPTGGVSALPMDEASERAQEAIRGKADPIGQAAEDSYARQTSAIK